MASAHEDVDVASGGRRRGRRRNLSWGTLFCFGSQDQEASSSAEGTTPPSPWERSQRRKKRTVPVDDGDLMAGTAADSAVVVTLVSRGGGGGTNEESPKRKGLRIPGCCFLAPARAPTRREHSSTMDRSKQRHPERCTEQPPPRRRRSQSHDKNSPPSEASRVQATGGGSCSRGDEHPRGAPAAETTRALAKSSKAGGAGVGAFGPVVGLSVVVAVSMVGLLGGRLWAVACVCVWLAALSRLRRWEEATAAAADGEVEVAG